MISSVNNNLKQQKMDKETVNQQIINGLKSKGIFIGSISLEVLETFANIMYEAINYTHSCKSDSELLRSSCDWCNGKNEPNYIE